MLFLNRPERDLKKRTKIFSIKIIKLVEYINENCGVAAKIIANGQLIRSGTAIGSNYRAACRCKSRKDFISKMGTVVEKVDETQYWLELLDETNLVKHEKLIDCLQESAELTAIMTASRNSAIINQTKK